VQAWETILEVLGTQGTTPCVYTHGATPASLKERIPKAPGVRIQRDAVACRYQVFHPAARSVGEEFASFSRSWSASSEQASLDERIAWLWSVENRCLIPGADLDRMYIVSSAPTTTERATVVVYIGVLVRWWMLSVIHMTSE